MAQTLMRDPAFRTHRRMMLEDQLAEIEHVIGGDLEDIDTSGLMAVDIWGNKLPATAEAEVEAAADSAALQGDVPIGGSVALGPGARESEVNNSQATADEVKDPEVGDLGTAEARPDASSTEDLITWHGQFSGKEVYRLVTP